MNSLAQSKMTAVMRKLTDFFKDSFGEKLLMWMNYGKSTKKHESSTERVQAKLLEHEIMRCYRLRLKTRTAIWEVF